MDFTKDLFGSERLPVLLCTGHGTVPAASRLWEGRHWALRIDFGDLQFTFRGGDEQ